MFRIFLQRVNRHHRQFFAFFRFVRVDADVWYNIFFVAMSPVAAFMRTSANKDDRSMFAVNACITLSLKRGDVVSKRVRDVK